MNKCHEEILEKIKRVSNKEKVTLHPDNYSGSDHLSYNVKTIGSRQVAKEWAKTNSDIAIADFTTFLDSLVKGKSMDEKMMVGKLLGYLPKLRIQTDPKLLDNWITYLAGWAEVDSLCQSNFTSKDLLSNWNKWESILISLSKRDHLNKKEHLSFY